MRFYDYVTHYEEYLSCPFPWATAGVIPEAERGVKDQITYRLDQKLIGAGHTSATKEQKKTARLLPGKLPFSFPNNLYSLRPYLEKDYPESMYTFYTLLLALVSNFSGNINQRVGIEPKAASYGDITNLLKHLLIEPIELFGPETDIEGLSPIDLATRMDLGSRTKLIQVGAFKRWIWGYMFKLQSERIFLHESRPTFNVYPSMIRAILRSSSDTFFEKLKSSTIKDLFKREKAYLLQFPKYTLSPTAVSYDISNKELWPKEEEEEKALLSGDEWMGVYMSNIVEEVATERGDFEYDNGRVVCFGEGDNKTVLGNIMVSLSFPVPSSTAENLVSSQVAKYFDEDNPRWDDSMGYTDMRGRPDQGLKKSLIAGYDKVAELLVKQTDPLDVHYGDKTQRIELDGPAEWALGSGSLRFFPSHPITSDGSAGPGDKPFFVYPRETFEFTDTPVTKHDMLVITASLYDVGGFESISSSKDGQALLNDKVGFIESRIAKEIVIAIPLLDDRPISYYINLMLDRQAPGPSRKVLKTILHLALGNMFLAANRDEKALPIRPGKGPSDDYQGHVSRAVAQKDLSKVTEQSLEKLANTTSQNIYKNRLLREPKFWTGREAGMPVLEIAKESIRSDPKYVCDLCHKRKDPEEYELITSAAMEKAVKAGFNPYEEGLAEGSDKIKEAARISWETGRTTWEREYGEGGPVPPEFSDYLSDVYEDSRENWLKRRVKLDVSGWSLCKACYPYVAEYLSAKDLEYPDNPPTAAIQRQIGRTSQHVKIFTEVPTPPWRTIFPKEHLKPVQRVPEGIGSCDNGAGCFVDYKRWKRCCGTVFRAANVSIAASKDSRDAGYLRLRAKGRLKKTGLILLPVPKLYNIGERLEHRLRSLQNKILDLKRKAHRQGVTFDSILEEEYYNTDDPNILSFLEEASSPVAGSMQIHWISQRRKWLEERGKKIPGSRKALQSKLNNLAKSMSVPSDWAGSGTGCGYGWGGFPCPEWQEAGEVCDHLPELRFTTPHTIKTSKKKVPKRLQRARKKAEKRKRFKRAAKRGVSKKTGRRKIIRPPEPMPPEAALEDEFEPETVEAWGIIGNLLSEMPGWGAKHAMDVLLGKLTPEQLVKVRKGLHRDTNMVKKVKKEYDNACQVCGLRLVDDEGKGYSEGAHIIPFAVVSAANRKDLDVKSNILILCPNHHTEFDLGSFTISPVETDYTEMLETGKTTIEIPHRRIDYMIEHLDPNNPYHGSQLVVQEGHNINPYFVAHRREDFDYLVSLLEGRLSRYGIIGKDWRPDYPGRDSRQAERKAALRAISRSGQRRRRHY